VKNVVLRIKQYKIIKVISNSFPADKAWDKNFFPPSSFNMLL
jgi:hypothetical protein